MTTLTIVPPCDFINANQRLHHHVKAPLTKAWRDAAADLIVCYKQPLYTRAHVTVSIRFPTNHRRDVGNFYPTAKAIVDGLVDAGMLPDDSDDHVLGPDLRRIRPNGDPLVVVTIETWRPW